MQALNTQTRRAVGPLAHTDLGTQQGHARPEGLRSYVADGAIVLAGIGLFTFGVVAVLAEQVKRRVNEVEHLRRPANHR